MALTTYTAGEVLTAASLNNNFASGGLMLVKSQVIGSAVSSVNVTGAFSATYDMYKIVVAGGVGSTNQDAVLKLGSTTTGYYYSGYYATFAGTAISQIPLGANAANFGAFMTYNTNTLYANVELVNPFSSSPTTINGSIIDPTTTGRTSHFAGYLANTTSYTDFTITPNGGTITGGTIYVYGYAKA